MENVIFYFSGTGNTHWAAKRFSEKLGNCKIINIAEFDCANKIHAERIGIMFPVYFWGLPNIIKNFIKKVRIEGNPYLFEAHTMGGYDGITVLQIKKLLAERQLNLDASYRFKLVNTMIVNERFFTIPDEKGIRKLFEVAEEQMNLYIKKVLAKEKHFYKEPIIYKPWHKSGFKLNETEGSLIPKRGKNFELSDSCIGCGTCELVCPVKNVVMEDGRPKWEEHCEYCLACIHSCPMEAINHGTSKGRKRYLIPEWLE